MASTVPVWRARLAAYTVPVVVLALLLALSAAVLAAGSGLGARLGWWHFSTGFAVLRWGARVGAAAGVVGLLALVVAALTRRWVPLGLAVLAVAVGAAALGIPRYHLYVARSVPPIHDITTDWEDPPQFQAVLPLRTGAHNPPGYDGPEVANRQRRFYGDIGPVRFREEPRAVLAAAERVTRGLGWDVVAVVPEDGRLEATDTTFWFGFTDDVVVRVRAAEGGGSRVDVRSKSRVGGSDVGANAARIRRFLEGLRGAGLTPAG